MNVSPRGTRSGHRLRPLSSSDGPRANSNTNGRAKPKRSVPPDGAHSPRKGQTFRQLDSRQLTMMSWCAQLTSFVLRSRTDFAACLKNSMRLQRTQHSTPSLFPIPLPPGDWFCRMPSSFSKKRRFTVHLNRAVCIIVLALNYWHEGGAPPLESLKRSSSSLHHTIYKRVRALIRSEVGVTITKLSDSGRRFPNLVARVAELSDVLTIWGPSSSPYDKMFGGYQVPVDNSVIEELSPYRSLDADRLRIRGTALWDPCPYLDDELFMGYREPLVLEIPGRQPAPGQHPLTNDRPEEIGKLARLWDSRGLLYIHKDVDVMQTPWKWVRVFNVYKNLECDRQIGDRRGLNFAECRVKGPSVDLPQGVHLAALEVDLSHEVLVTAVTDRRDFYHQLMISERKAICNTVGPPVDLSEIADTKAFEEFLVRSSSRRYNRLLHGDRLEQRNVISTLDPGEKFLVSFKSVFQGDHTGVDVATCAHKKVLQMHGLLGDGETLTARRALRSKNSAQGLCIDDYFAVCAQEKTCAVGNGRAASLLQKANLVYEKEGMEGSPEKDVLSSVGKAVGAVINSGPGATRRGLATLASPAQKRMGLAWISMQLCQLGWTSDCLHLCLMGGWTSAVLFRRPLLSLFSNAFSLVDAKDVSADAPKMIPLTRKVRDELVLAAVLFPLMSTELQAGVLPEVFATDASDTHGAVVSTFRTEDEARVLWRTNFSKASMPKMKSAREAVLFKTSNDSFEADPFEVDVRRPLAFRFDFVEVFAGAAGITEFIASRGFSVCTPIDLSRSLEFNLLDSRVMEWLSFLISEELIKGFAVEPPCTTFSVMRRPALRDFEHPYGFDLTDLATLTGNSLCLRGLQCIHLGQRHNVAGLFEAPWSTKAKYLPPFKKKMADPDVEKVRCDSCQYGSPHLKSFLFLLVHLRSTRIRRRCGCLGPHLQIQGKYTKASATYTPELASEIAETFIERFLSQQELDEVDNSSGLENQYVNEIALSSKWNLCQVWKFRKPGTHINLKEMASVYRLCLMLARLKRPVRASVLLDSNVVRCAILKGRSSSQSMSSLLNKIGSCIVACGLQLAVPFCPTRLNPADDPTRGKEVRSSSTSLGVAGWDLDDAYDLAESKTLRRWASNWVRLMLLILGPKLVSFRDRSVFRFVPIHRDSRFQKPQLSFDSSKGFPGEGPFSGCSLDYSPWCSSHVLPHAWLILLHASSFFALVVAWIFIVLWIFISVIGLFRLAGRDSSKRFLRLVVGFSLVGSSFAMESFSNAELRRAEFRAAAGPLQKGRFVTSQTGALREGLLKAFLNWVDAQGLNSGDLFEDSYHTVEDINLLLAAYGRQCFEQGKTLNRYSETINAVSSWKPHLRRVLQGAWDVSYAWARREPPIHHLSMPFQVLLALLSIALCWGWTRVAGVLTLGWSGLLRPGEIFQATRGDLYLPSDGGGLETFALLAITEPKTRYTAARHQASKIDIPDMVQMLELCFRDLRPHERLWNSSSQTLRTRFRQLLDAAHLSERFTPGIKQLELASLRPGGATWLMLQTESGDLVMRRGRWASYRMMSIYVQEVAAVTYLKLIPANSKHRVLFLAKTFPQALLRAEQLYAAKLPPSMWYRIFAPR